MSELELEKRTNIEFLVKLGKSGNKIKEILLQVYGDNGMNKTAVYKGVKRVSEGRESVTDEERSGQPATSRTEENIAENFTLSEKFIGCRKHSRASEHRQRNGQENLN